MTGRNIILSAIIATIIFAINASSVLAIDVPSYPTCTNPQGNIVANHSNGPHGVAGDSNTYLGLDIVYSQGDGNYTQCLCTENGSGVQTNWLSIPQASQEEIDELINDGWILVQNGANWGLNENQYLAKNINYTCKAVGGSSSENNSDGGTGGSDGGSSSVDTYLSLASTGNKAFIFSIFLTGITAVLLGLALNFRRN